VTTWRGARLREALRLYVITDRALARGRPDIEIAREAIAGGATALQLRWKAGPLSEALQVGHALRALCREAGVLFVVNDRVDLALALEADGVHVGVSDLPVPETRKLVGESMVVGFSPETLEQALAAEAAGADYLGWDRSIRPPRSRTLVQQSDSSTWRRSLGRSASRWSGSGGSRLSTPPR
jgi:thiamine-phosphate pyrophosphorylase